jgi:integrase
MTLNELLRTAAHPLWKGLSYERTAYRNVEEFIEVVGNLDITEVKTVTLDAWYKAQGAKGIAGSTINRKMVNIHQVLKYALDRDWIMKLPVLQWNPESEGRIRWLEAHEEDKMFALLTEWSLDEEARFIRLLIETGMRRGELLALQPQNVQGRWIRIWKNKTKTPRSVPLTDKAVEALEGFAGWGINENDLRRVWDMLRESMGLQDDPDFVLHSLRHTTATRLLKKTKDITKVQKLLGHRKLQTTMRYAHISDEDLFQAVCGQ